MEVIPMGIQIEEKQQANDNKPQQQGAAKWVGIIAFPATEAAKAAVKGATKLNEDLMSASTSEKLLIGAASVLGGLGGFAASYGAMKYSHSVTENNKP
jgi:hypothetical protein